MKTSILKSARGQAALVALAALLFSWVGVPIDEVTLTTLVGKLSAAGAGLLGVWSAFRSNPIEARGILTSLMQRRTWMILLSAIGLASESAGKPVDLAGLADHIPTLLTMLLSIASQLRGDSAGTLAARS